MTIVIIGAGPGGYETAVEAAKKGAEVVLVTKGEFGGTCLNEGCIPTKALCRTAEIAESFAQAEEFGFTNVHYNLDYEKAVARKDAVIEQLRSGVATLLKHPNITIVHGTAKVKNAGTVTVDGETEIQADKIIIAAGSVSASLPIPGLELEGVVDSAGILSMTKVPRRLGVIGGGVIGLEFASIFNSFGSEVTVLEYFPNILPRFDSDISKRLKLSLSKKGIGISTGAEVKSITPSEDGLEIHYVLKGAELSVTVDKALMAVGRRPAVEGLGLDEAGIEYTRRGIAVDSNMETSLKGVYAVGDVTGGMMLAHAATFQGRRALAHIFGESDSIDLSLVPAAVFTSPEAAMVGRTEDELKAAGEAYQVHKSFFRANGKAVAMGQTDGLCKLLEGPDGRILGCHIYGLHAADLIQEVTALMARGATVMDLSQIIHAHPTLSEVILSAAQ